MNTPMPMPMHIIEPTLADQSGHCYSYIQSLLKANKKVPLISPKLWINQQGVNLFNSLAHCEGYFSRRWRHFELFFLYRHLTKTQASIFIPTATRLDLMLLHHLTKKLTNSSRIYLHFHQFTRTPQKLELIQSLAKKHPDWVIMAPTQRLLSIFKQAGFPKCYHVPCPSYTPMPKAKSPPFHQLLYAGAARADKGFPSIVALAQFFSEKNIKLPFSIQVSPPVSGRYDKATRKAIKKLDSLEHMNIDLKTKTLEQEDYQRQFSGSISLLLYDPLSYYDKFSGIALDAICAQAPIITVANTWMGDIVKSFRAGEVISDRKPGTVYQAVQTIIQDYAKFQTHCHKAAKKLIAWHDPLHTLNVLTGELL